MEPASVVLSLLRHLVPRSLRLTRSIWNQFISWKKRASQIAFHEPLSILLSESNDFARLFIVVDALDEYPGGDDDFLAKFQTLIQHEHINMFFTSRPIHANKALGCNAIVIEMHTPLSDIKNYISGQFEKLRLSRFSPKEKKEIMDIVMWRSKAKFLVVRLYMDFIVHCPTLEALLEQKPETVLLALEVLTWILFARRALTMKELLSALAIQIRVCELDEKDSPFKESLAALGVIVTVSPNAQTVMLLHYSAKEYLTENLSTWTAKFPMVHQSHALLARKCITYLRLNQFSGKPPGQIADLGDRMNRYPLLAYAAANWGWHAQKAKDDEELSNDAMGLFSSDAHTMAAGLVMAALEEHPTHYEQAYRNLRPLHIAAIFGLDELLKRLISTNAHDLNAVTTGDWTALHWAARHGSEEVLRLLLRARADSTDLQGRTALYLACWARQLETVRVLLSHRNRADAKICNIHGTTPLHYAARQGDDEIVRELLDHSDVYAVDALGFTALDEATRKDHQIVIRTLQKFGPGNHAVLGWDSAAQDINWSAYEIDEEKIDHGARWRSVHLTCAQKEGKRRYAIKNCPPVFRKTFHLMNDAGTRIKYFLSERDILHKLHHPNIVKYLDFDEDPDQNSMLLYMEYCVLGDLGHSHGWPSKSAEHDVSDAPSLDQDGNDDDDDDGFYTVNSDVQNKCTPLDGLTVWALIYQISAALAYLHYGLAIGKDGAKHIASFKRSWEYIIHRDIKSANVVMQMSDDEKCIFKLCDLGVATEAGKGAGANTTQFIGTREFHPPEVLRGGSVDN
ncbi:hypothetical protein NUW58_g6637 [Xylaria curta]|uniref:Uncharacterized protein n=1 Tax=Xylaria curta TaxID=42375 RepID=A0ACC1NT60_9PEZI|nr:hypothetical protein NUW58_g6637 [Xylaria curta]